MSHKPATATVERRGAAADAVFYLDAIRLAMVGAANEAAFIECAQRILNEAPQGPPESTQAPAILVRAIRDGAMSLSTNVPSGIGA